MPSNSFHQPYYSYTFKNASVVVYQHCSHFFDIFYSFTTVCGGFKVSGLKQMVLLAHRKFWQRLCSYLQELSTVITESLGIPPFPTHGLIVCVTVTVWTKYRTGPSVLCCSGCLEAQSCCTIKYQLVSFCTRQIFYLLLQRNRNEKLLYYYC